MDDFLFTSPDRIIEQSRYFLVPLPSQKTAISRIATILSMHLAKIDVINKGVKFEQLPQTSAFILGSTGSGKTFVIKQLCKASDIGFAVIDGTSLSPSGYKGVNLGAALKGIVDSNKNFKEGFVVLIDEADKFFFKGNKNADAANVQSDFLKLLDSDTYTIDTGDNKTETIDISKTLFLFSGACSGIAEVIKKNHNLNTVGIGFRDDSAENSDNSDLMSLTNLDDLISYGMLRELASRINTVVSFSALSKEDYKQLITGKGNTSLEKFKRLFEGYGVTLEISAEAVEFIVEECMVKNVGARTIDSILSESFGEAFAEISDESVYKVILEIENSELKLNYKRNGSVRRVRMFKYNNSYESNRPRVNILNIISCENDMEELALAMMSYVGQAIHGQIAAVYHFLSCALRFMKTTLPQHEQSLVMLAKLAGDTFTEKPGTASNFDCMVCYVKDKKDTLIYKNMVHHFELYKLYEASNTHKAIVASVNNIRCNFDKVLNELNCQKSFISLSSEGAY